MNGPVVEFQDVEVVKTTGAAMLCRVFNEEHWIPFSQAHEDRNEVWEEGDFGELVISEWIATQKGLV